MGRLLFGYDWVVIGGAKPFYEQFFQIANDPFMQGWAMSVALLGCLIGAMLSGVLADRPKKLLIVSALIFLVFCLLYRSCFQLYYFSDRPLSGGYRDRYCFQPLPDVYCGSFSFSDPRQTGFSESADNCTGYPGRTDRKLVAGRTCAG